MKKKTHNEKPNDLYCTPNIVRVIKSKRMRWAGHVACMEKRRGGYRILVGKPEGDPGVDGRIILSGSSGSGMWGYGLDPAGSG